MQISKLSTGSTAWRTITLVRIWRFACVTHAVWRRSLPSTPRRYLIYWTATYQTDTRYVREQIPGMSENRYQVHQRTDTRYFREQIPGLSENRYQVHHITNTRYIREQTPGMSKNKYKIYQRIDTRYIREQIPGILKIKY